MAITKFISGKLVTIPEKPKKSFPKINEAYRLPSAFSLESSFLVLVLYDIDNSGRKGIKVSNSGVLPLEGPDIQWSLGYCWFQGTEPASKNWIFQKLILKNGNFDITIESVPKCTYQFFLQATNSTKNIAYTITSIITPEDQTVLSLDSILTDDILSKNEKPYFKMLYDTALVEQTALISAADNWIPAINPEKNAYNTAITNTTNYLASLNPAYSDFTTNTNLGTGGGNTLRNYFITINQKKQELQKKIDEFVKVNINDIFADDKLTPNDKLKVKTDYDNEKIEQTKALTGYDALAYQFNVSATVYDAAITSLETRLATLSGWNNTTKDWTDYSTTQDLGTGGGIVLRGKFADILRAKVDLKKAIDDARASAIASSISTGVPIVNGLPALPNVSYPLDKVVWDTITKRLYRSTGNTWENPTTSADQIIGQITAGQITAATIATSTLNFDTLTSGNYAESGGYATAGFKFDKSTDVMKVGPNGLLIGPYVFNQSSLKVDRIINGNFVKGINPWNLSNGNAIVPLDNLSGSGVNVVSINPNKGINSNTGALQVSAQSAIAGTPGYLGIMLNQVISTPQVPYFTPRIQFTIGYYRETAWVNAGTQVSLYITNTRTGTRSQVFQQSFQSAADTIAWSDFDIDISQYITGTLPEQYAIEFNIATTAEALKLAHSYIRNIKMLM